MNFSAATPVSRAVNFPVAVKKKQSVPGSTACNCFIRVSAASLPGSWGDLIRAVKMLPDSGVEAARMSLWNLF